MANPTDKRPTGAPEAPTSLEEQRRAAEQGRDQKELQIPDADPKETIITSTVALSAAAESPDSYENLPADRKAMLQMGFKAPHSAYEEIDTKELGQKRIIAITASKENLAALEQKLIESGFALPLNTPVISGPDSSTITRFFLTPHANNVFVVAKSFPEIPAEITVSGNDTKGAIRFGDLVIPLDASVLSRTTKSDINNRVLSLTTKKEKKSTSTFLDRTHHLFTPLPLTNSHSRALAIELAQKPNRLPENMQAESSYLVININALLTSNDPAKDKILDKIGNLAISEDFTIALDQNGNLVIADFAQRSGSYMAGLAADIEHSTENKTSILLAKGVFKKDGTVTGIENYPDAGTLAHWAAIAKENPGTYLTAATKKTINEGRDATTRELETEDQYNSDELLKLTKVSRRPKLRIGGPDKLIGNADAIEKMRNFTKPNNKSKLLVINGGAGSGKSRLADELLKDNPTALVASVDASGENIPGAALSDLAITIAEAMESRLTDVQKTRFSEELSELQRFVALPDDEKIRQAQTAPHFITEACQRGLFVLEKSGGSFLFAIDDIHHIDRFSEKHIMTLVEKFLTNSKSKVMMMRRPEETYHSTAQENLITNIHNRFRGQSSEGQRPVEIIEPNLNLQDPKTARDYVFYSLPVEMRINEVTGKDKELGNWPQQLAAKCRTPFDLTSLISSLLENPEQSLIITPDSISIRPEALDELAKIKKHTDLQTYHENRVRRLEAPAQAVLQYVSILGAKLSKSKLIDLATSLGGFSPEEANQAFIDLQKGGYIIADEKEGCGIQHDNYKNIALSSLNETKKRELIIKLYLKFNDSGDVHNDKKFALLCEISNSIPLNDVNFWAHYTARANQALHDAKQERSAGRGYEIAMTILGDLNIRKHKNEPLIQALTALYNGGEAAAQVDPTIRKMLTSSLFAVVQNGLNLGRFKKTTEAIAILEKIGAQEYLTEAYSIGFHAAQIQHDTRMMGRYFQRYISRPDKKESEVMSMKLRLAFKKADTEGFGECEKLMSSPEYTKAKAELASSDHVAHTEFNRLEQRIKLDRIRKNLENKDGADGDVVLDPGLVSPADFSEIIKIKRELDIIFKELQEHPDNFDPLQELHLRDQLAEIQAFTGNYEAAAQSLNEVWRLAQQMQIPTEAVRAAKIKGDIEIMMGVAQIQLLDGKGMTAQPFKNGTIFPKRILKALQTYTELGFGILEGKDAANKNKIEAHNPYQLTMRGQRLRGISILALSYQNQIAASKVPGSELASTSEIKAELIPHLKTAIEDFKFMNQSPEWKVIFNNKPFGGIYSYYLTSSMGHVLQAIKDLEISESELGTEIPDVLDTTTYPGFLPENIADALKTAISMKDNTGEVDNRKLLGLAKIIEAGEKQATDSMKLEAITKFRGLKDRHSEVVELRKAA
ncbi:MAG: ATP-binding protein [Candidatus Peregrinibacteria bacterium]|nr:ATP-binding protein [Candidatus Peregrinibacteria bacterium]